MLGRNKVHPDLRGAALADLLGGNFLNLLRDLDERSHQFLEPD